MFASSLLEVRLGQAETEQMQMRSTAESAKIASDRAIAQAQLLKEEQERTTQQVTDLLSAHAEETQRRIQGATSVALQTRSEVSILSSLAQTANLTAKMASEKIEREVESLQQALQVQKVEVV